MAAATLLFGSLPSSPAADFNQKKIRTVLETYEQALNVEFDAPLGVWRDLFFHF